jgi:hypothetical protein
MQTIQNTSLQAFNIPFNTKKGMIEIYLRPKQVLEVPATYSSIVLDNLITRRMVKVVKTKIK